MKKLTKPCVMLLSLPILALTASAQCSNASLDGAYDYLIVGGVKSGDTAAFYDEFGQITLDGNGNITSGQTTATIAGTVTTLPVSGNYTIQASCAGTVTISTSGRSVSYALQVAENGALTFSVATGSPDVEVAEAKFYRAATYLGNQCATTTLAGTYGFSLSGNYYTAGVPAGFGETGQAVFDGQGNISIPTGEYFNTVTAAAVPSTKGTYVLNSNCTGTLKVTSSLGTFNYAFAQIQDGTILLMETDSGSVVAGSANLLTPEYVLPQLPFGGGWYTAMYFTNANSYSVSFTVNFTLDGGTAMNIPGVGSSQQVNLAPHSTTIIEALNQGSLVQGYATFTLPVGVNGYGVFRQTVPGINDQEAVVNFVSAAATGAILTWDDTAYTTAVAIANPSAAPTTVTITVSDNNGNQIGSTQVALGAFSKTENVLAAFPGLGGMANLRGTALFTVDNGNVAVLGLRFNGSALTSIPTTSLQ